MVYHFNFGSNVGVLPSSVADKYLNTATENELKVIIFISSNSQFLYDLENSYEKIGKCLNLTIDDVKSAVAFWIKNNIISKSNNLTDISDNTKIPNYDGKEIADIVIGDDLHSLIDLCADVLGIMINPTDANIIVTLHHHLGLSSEYILILCSYCKQIGKTSLAYIQKTAYNLYDEGIDDIVKLESYLNKKNEQNDYNTMVSRIFGISSRALTKKEVNRFSKWQEWGYDENMLSLAYEITIEQTGKYAISYIDKILSNWYDSGYKTIEDVNNAKEDYEKSKAENNGSFNTNEFFELALKRSKENILKDNQSK